MTKVTTWDLWHLPLAGHWHQRSFSCADASDLPREDGLVVNLINLMTCTSHAPRSERQLFGGDKVFLESSNFAAASNVNDGFCCCRCIVIVANPLFLLQRPFFCCRQIFVVPEVLY